MWPFDKLNEHVLGWMARLDPTRRDIFQASLFLFLLLAVGTFGYALIEGWPWIDGLYMTFITLTTIGFAEVHTLTTAGRIFTIGIAIFGIGSVAFIATRTAQWVLTGQRIRERHMKNRISRMKNHYIICGYGRVGKRIVQDLKRNDKPFVVIDWSNEEIDLLQEEGIPHVQGDAEEDDTLYDAGIGKARGLILTLPEDSANVFVTLMARELKQDLMIIARTNHHKNRRKLMHAGANKVISPDEIGADRMAQVILRPHVDRFMDQVLQTGALGLLIEEVKVQENAPLAGHSLAASNFRQQFDAIVIAVIDGKTDEMKFNPSPQATIKASDILIVLGSMEMIECLREEGCRP